MSRRAEKAAPPEPRASQRRAALLVCGLLLLAVRFVFAQTIDYGFVNYDDEMNLYGNPAIRQGLSAEGIRWARTTTHGSQWAPVTWISYLADYQLYGLKPHRYHLTNVLLHSATTVLLFLVLWRMTGRLWPCAFVAAVFAVHPLHVETVAWLSERKGLLSGLFFVLTLGAYVEYVRRRPLHVRSLAYLAMLLFFALGLMSKPILVTLPFVLLLLDYWPLRRMSHLSHWFPRSAWEPAECDAPHPAGRSHAERGNERKPLAASQAPPTNVSSQEIATAEPLWRLIAEKIPLLLLSIVSCAIAPSAQGKAVIALEKIPLPARIGNALVSYVDYLGKTLWPTNLAVFYPHPLDTLPTWKPAVALLVLLGITAAVLVRWRRNPYLPVGWFWYLGMLVPAIGLVQIGVHAMADRYMYLPQIGLCLALTWGVLDFVRSWPNRTLVCATTASLVVVALTACAAQQTTYWRDSESLWTHALRCTPPNNVAHSNLAAELFKQNRFSEAIPQYEAALKFDPSDAMSYCGLGNALMRLAKLQKSVERYEEAAAQYQQALKLQPDSIDAHCNLAKALAHLGRLDDAIAHYEAALKIAPDSADIRYNLDFVLRARAQQKAE
jgi:Tfp pilus assembly protein PilF